MDREQIADLFMRGQDCGQVVLSHYADRVGISADDANRISSAFGGGSGVGGTCGAVVGAMIVLGCFYGHKGPDDMEQRELMMSKRAEFMEKWKEKRESSECKDLLGHDIGTPEGLQAILDAGLLFEFCPGLVSDAIEILDKMLEQA